MAGIKDTLTKKGTQVPGLSPSDHNEILASFYGERPSTAKIVHSFDGLQPSPRFETHNAKPTEPTLFSVAIKGFLEEFKGRIKGLHDPNDITQVLANMLQELQLVCETTTPANILVDDSLPSVDNNIYSGLPPAGTPTANLSLYIRRE